MAERDIPSPKDISLAEFRAALARYPALLGTVSSGKGVKNGATLADLDAFRYSEAPARFGLDAQAEPLGLDDVKTLVAWKLRHGKFRPTLMKLVSDNTPPVVHDTVRAALQAYRETEKGRQADATKAQMAAVHILCRLRGIGPATASLLLAVHDQQHVLFFADEAYAWLCGGGSGNSSSPKYTLKEYEALSRQAKALQERLAQNGEMVSAADVEKVAYVLLRAGQEEPAKTNRETETETETKAHNLPSEPPTSGKTFAKSSLPNPPKPPQSKRKHPGADDQTETATPARRSQRVRKASSE